MIRKRWLRRTVVAVACAVAVRTVWLVAEREWRQSEGEKAYAAAVAETDRTDPDWRWDDLNAKRPRPPAGKNGADVVTTVKALSRKGWGLKLLSDGWTPYRDIPSNERYPHAVLAEARRELDGSRSAVELARTLKDYPDEGFRALQLAPNPLATLLEDTQQARLVAVLLAWDAAVAVEDGDRDRAAEDLIAALNASRSVGDEPFYISQLIRMAARTQATRAAERVLAQVELPEPRLAVLQAAWASDAEQPLLLYALRGDRAVYDVVFASVAAGRVTLDELIDMGRRDSDSPLARLWWWTYRGGLPADRATTLGWMTQSVEAARRPIDEQRAIFSRLEDLPKDRNKILTGLLVHKKVSGTKATWTSAAVMRSAVVGLACERFRLKHGRWPASLDELPRDLLADVPLDPFDGRPLRFRRLDDGVVVYSVGEDRADDGGDTRHAANPDGRDDGFRLWDPDARRQPAPPPTPEQPADPENP